MLKTILEIKNFITKYWKYILPALLLLSLSISIIAFLRTCNNTDNTQLLIRFIDDENKTLSDDIEKREYIIKGVKDEILESKDIADSIKSYLADRINKDATS